KKLPFYVSIFLVRDTSCGYLGMRTQNHAYKKQVATVKPLAIHLFRLDTSPSGKSIPSSILFQFIKGSFITGFAAVRCLLFICLLHEAKESELFRVCD
ncbi:MAG TPA: hypothetical protein VIM41_08855, partial [Gammaproteobacteria bacterium]